MQPENPQDNDVTPRDNDDNSNNEKSSSTKIQPPPPKMLLAIHQCPPEEIWAPGYQDEYNASNTATRCTVDTHGGRLMGQFETMEQLGLLWQHEISLCADPVYDPLHGQPFELLCPVMYTRVLGSIPDAWMILVHGAEQPYVVVREDSPALEFLIQRAWMEQQPLPIWQRPPTPAPLQKDAQAPVPETSQQPDNAPSSWERFREYHLLHRWVPFAACDYRPEPGMPGNPVAATHFDFDPEMLMFTPDIFTELSRSFKQQETVDPPGVPIYLPPWFRPGLGIDFDRFFQERQQWLQIEQQQNETGGEPGVHDTEEADDDDGGEDAAVKQEAVHLLRIETDMAEAGLTPYADLEILWGGTNTVQGKTREATHAWARGLGRGLRGLLSDIGIMSPAPSEPLPLPSQEPEPEPVQSVRFADPPAQKKEKETVAAEPPAPAPRIEVHEHRDTDAENPIKQRESGCPHGQPLRSVGSPETQKVPQPQVIPLMQGRWYRMTVHEYRTWLCVARSPMQAASLIQYLNKLDGGITAIKQINNGVISKEEEEEGEEEQGTSKVPKWLQQVSGNDRSMIRRLLSILRRRSDKWLALAEAQDRLVSTLQENLESVTTPPPPPKKQNDTVDSGGPTVTLSKAQWESLQAALNEFKRAHKDCLNG